MRTLGEARRLKQPVQQLRDADARQSDAQFVQDALGDVLEELGFAVDRGFELSIRRVGGSTAEASVRQALSSRTKSKLVEGLLRTPAGRAMAAADDPAAAEVSFLGMAAIAEAVAQSAHPAMALVIDYTSQVRSENQGEDPGFRQLMLSLADAGERTLTGE